MSRTHGLLIIFIVLTVGCHTPAPIIHPPYSVYQSPSLLERTPRRVLLMPVTNLTFDQGYSKKWYLNFAGELRATKRFDVVTTDVSVPCVQQCLALVERGQFSERAILAVRDYFRVDGVLFVTQSDFYPYSPPSISVAVNLVDASTGETVAAVDGHWDSNEKNVHESMKLFARKSVLAKDLSNTDLVSISPTYFGKFVAHDIANALCHLMRPDSMFAEPYTVEPRAGDASQQLRDSEEVATPQPTEAKLEELSQPPRVISGSSYRGA